MQEPGLGSLQHFLRTVGPTSSQANLFAIELQLHAFRVVRKAKATIASASDERSSRINGPCTGIAIALNLHSVNSGIDYKSCLNACPRLALWTVSVD